jgi:hypothetical protein
MTTNTQPKSYSRKSAGVLLLVGVLAGVIVGGGVGVIAASTTETVTLCANKKTNVTRYAKNGKCAKTETKVMLNQTGPAGAKGDAGIGVAGPAGAAGPAGVNAAVAITQQSVCDGSDADTVANELCKIGMTGPGGGLIFFVDYDDEYAGLDYLEAAPIGWGNAITVNQGGLTSETTGSSTVDPLMKWCSNTSSSLGLTTWAKSAVGAGASNTSTADATCAGGAIQAVSDYAGGSKTDWFLPSVGEAMLMYTNLRQLGVGGFASFYYWLSSETEFHTPNVDAGRLAWYQSFQLGEQGHDYKTTQFYVRPVRAF